MCWTTPPKYTSLQAGHAPKRVDSLVKHSPAFKQQPWRTVTVKTTTRGPAVWRIKHAMVQLGNRLLVPDVSVEGSEGDVRCRERLGGLLRYYHRAA